MTQPRRLSKPTLLVLGTFLEAPAEWRYGYDLLRSTGVMAGTLYPLLQRIADQGWLATRWEARGESGRPPRHLYRMTAAGVEGARSMLQRAEQRGWSLGDLRAEMG